MKVQVRFGSYGQHPFDAKLKEIDVPEDIKFYTAGEHYINHGLHSGALHYIAITRADDATVEKCFKGVFGPDIIYEQDKHAYSYKIFRMNGYAFVMFDDCVFDSEITTITEKELNNLIKQEYLYYVYLNENYNIIKILRINNIKAAESVDCSVIYHTAEIGDNRFEAIHIHNEYSLQNIVSPHHSVLLRRLDNIYGLRLFNDMTEQLLSTINPHQYHPTINYDLDWLNKNWHTVYGEAFNPLINDWEQVQGLMYRVPNKDVENKYEKIFNFEEELPINE